MTRPRTSGSGGPRTSPRRKRLGQHFLRDGRVLDRLISLIAPAPDQHVVEIGPGKGILTGRLVGEVAHLHAIELDPDLATRLQERMADDAGFSLTAEDVLALDPETIALAAKPAPDQRVRVVGNLPYSVSTAIVRHLVPHHRLFDDMVFMVQDEVAQRLVAGPNDSAYGALSVLIALYARPRLEFPVRPSAFVPPPAVQSRVVTLTTKPMAAPAVCDRVAILARHAFAQRRKLLTNNLKTAGHPPATVLSALHAMGCPERTRAQELSPEQFVALEGHLSAGEPAS